MRATDRRARRGLSVPRAGIVVSVLVLGLLAVSPAPVRAQAPAPSAKAARYIPPKECPPPEGFRAVLHLLDNNSPFLQMYPLAGMPMPKNMFKSFGQDMIPKCALERTYDDLAKFRTEWAKATTGLPPTPSAEQLNVLGALSFRAFKRWQWTHLMTYSKAPEFEYDGSQIPELKEGQDWYFATALEASKKYIDGLTAYQQAFTGVENDAVEAKRRLDADDKRPKPRAAKEIALDQAKVASYERRFKANKDLLDTSKWVRASFKSISRVHSLQQWSWPASGNPAVTLAPLIAQITALIAKLGGK